MRLVRRSQISTDPAASAPRITGAPARPPCACPRCRRADRRRSDRSLGQSLVEFSLVFTPLMLILLALVQFGFVFSGYITMTNAVREGARIGSIYAYDRTLSKDQNDTARNNAMRTALLASFNGLTQTAPNFTSSTTWSKSDLTWTTGDLSVAYVIPSGISDSDPRVGERFTLRATYHLTLFIPFIAQLLSRDSGGRLRITTESTMVIN